MTEPTLFSFSQALQLVALAPCVLVILYLLTVTRSWAKKSLPILYFLTLGAGFFIPLSSLFMPQDAMPEATFGLAFLENFAPAISYLLIVQFILNRLPSASHFVVLALPAIGGGTFLYLANITDQACFTATGICLSPYEITLLYRVMGSGLIFMLLTLFLARNHRLLDGEEHARAHKYWLIMALICVNLTLLGFDLAFAAGMLEAPQYLFATTMVRISFIYMILVSLFRVFHTALPTKEQDAGSRPLSTKEQEIADQLVVVLTEKKPYREYGFNRAAFVQELGIKEHQLSRIINMRFRKSFSELANECRIDEAKRRLHEEKTAITTIAYEVGFNNITSFNRVFKQYTGQSPSQYRATIREIVAIQKAQGTANEESSSLEGELESIRSAANK